MRFCISYLCQCRSRPRIDTESDTRHRNRTWVWPVSAGEGLIRLNLRCVASTNGLRSIASKQYATPNKRMPSARLPSLMISWFRKPEPTLPNFMFEIPMRLSLLYMWWRQQQMKWNAFKCLYGFVNYYAADGVAYIESYNDKCFLMPAAAEVNYIDTPSCHVYSVCLYLAKVRFNFALVHFYLSKLAHFTDMD